MKLRNTILCVDDEEDLLEILSYNLKKDGYSVFTATNGESAIDKALKVKPDLIVLDIMMDELDGFEVCKILRGKEETKNTPIIFLSAKTEEIDEILGLELGADDYITKPFSPRKVLAKVRAIFRRVSIDKAEKSQLDVITVKGIEINFPNFTVTIDQEEKKFLRKEFQLLYHLMKHPRRAFSRDELLDSVWGDDAYFTDRTVDVHVAKIRKKLGQYSNYLKTVQGIGYKFSEY